MRYFTKQWYNDTIVAEMCFQFRKTDKAGEYSDKFFERLYAVEKRAFLKYSKRISRASRLPFDSVAAADEFDKNYRDNLEFVQKNLPEEILSEIKDIRVLALGSVTHDMALTITRFCGKLNRQCEAIERKYNDASDEVDERLGGKLSQALLALTGASLSSIEAVGDDTVIVAQGEAYELKLTLEGCSCLECDDGIIGTSVLKHELLVAENDEDGYEFSILSMGSDSSLYTLTYTTQKITAEKLSI